MSPATEMRQQTWVWLPNTDLKGRHMSLYPGVWIINKCLHQFDEGSGQKWLILNHQINESSDPFSDPLRLKSTHKRCAMATMNNYCCVLPSHCRPSHLQDLSTKLPALVQNSCPSWYISIITGKNISCRNGWWWASLEWTTADICLLTYITAMIYMY